MQLDWSSDSNFLQTVTADYDLSFCKLPNNHLGDMLFIVFFIGDVKSLSPEKSPIAMKDVKWYTHNSTVGFLVAGNVFYIFVLIFFGQMFVVLKSFLINKSSR